MTVVERPDLLSGVRADLLGWCGATPGQGALCGVPGSQAWSLALQHTSLTRGDRVVLTRAGNDSFRWAGLARRLGYDVVCIDVDPGQGPSADELAHLLWWDPSIKAVFVARDETSTGIVADVAGLRRGMDLTGSDALLLVDCSVSWRSGEVHQQAWGADLIVTSLAGQAAALVSWSERLPGLAALPTQTEPPSGDVLLRIRRQLDAAAAHPHARARLRASAGSTVARLRSWFDSPATSR